MDNRKRQIKDFIKVHPEVADAMEIFKISMKEYEKAFKFLNESHTYTSNTTGPIIHKK